MAPQAPWYQRHWLDWLNTTSVLWISPSVFVQLGGVNNENGSGIHHFPLLKVQIQILAILKLSWHMLKCCTLLCIQRSILISGGSGTNWMYMYLGPGSAAMVWFGFGVKLPNCLNWNIFELNRSSGSAFWPCQTVVPFMVWDDRNMPEPWLKLSKLPNCSGKGMGPVIMCFIVELCQHRVNGYI